MTMSRPLRTVSGKRVLMHTKLALVFRVAECKLPRRPNYGHTTLGSVTALRHVVSNSSGATIAISHTAHITPGTFIRVPLSRALTQHTSETHISIRAHACLPTTSCIDPTAFAAMWPD
jgi:hypothetical protein